MNDTQIECFLLTCQTLNFTRAAEKLNYTPQAISRLIVSLEEELGVQLFERKRTGRAMVLTPAGTYYMEMLTRDRSHKARIMGDIYGRYRWLSGHFRLGISEWIHATNNELADALITFQREQPAVTLTALYDDDDHLRTKLMAGELDAIMISNAQGMQDRELGVTPVAKERRYLISSMRSMEEVSFDKECWGLPFLYRPTRNWGSSEFLRIMRKNLEEYGIYPREIRMIPTVMSINTALMITECVTISDVRFGHAVRVPHLHYFELPAGTEESYLCCVWSFRNENPRLLDFIRSLQRSLGDYRPDWEQLLPSNDFQLN